MEYTPMEKDVLDMMQRTDFKNISKGDVISFASKIGELRPEVAKEVLAQFPEFVGLMKSSLTEYKEMLDTIVSSDDASIKEYYGVANKEMDQAADSRKQFYAFVKQVQADCSKLLDNPNLPPEMMIEMSEIFGVDKSGISRHLKKYLKQVNQMKSGCCKNCNNHEAWSNRRKADVGLQLMRIRRKITNETKWTEKPKS